LAVRIIPALQEYIIHKSWQILLVIERVRAEEQRFRVKRRVLIDVDIGELADAQCLQVRVLQHGDVEAVELL
jgi:hypothetical protein